MLNTLVLTASLLLPNPSSTNNPNIVSHNSASTISTTFQSDYDSLITILSYLDSLADNYFQNQTRQEKNLEILSYIRSFNATYTSYAWNFAGGPIDTDFVNFVDYHPTYGQLIREYFAHFTPIGNICTQIHSSLQGYTQQENYFLTDYWDDTIKIDLIHMFAAINGGYKLLSSGENQPLETDVFSWAGDLQTVYCQDTNNDSHEDIKSWDDIFDMPHFEKSDFYADIDAYNIVREYLNSNFNSSVGSAVYHYYDIISDYYDYRYTLFVNTATENDWFTCNSTDPVTIFQKKCFDMMRLSLDDNGVVTHIGNSPNLIKYYLLGTNNYPNSLLVRKKLGKYFSEYCLYLAGETPSITVTV